MNRQRRHYSVNGLSSDSSEVSCNKRSSKFIEKSSRSVSKFDQRYLSKLNLNSPPSVRSSPSGISSRNNGTEDLINDMERSQKHARLALRNSRRSDEYETKGEEYASTRVFPSSRTSSKTELGSKLSLIKSRCGRTNSDSSDYVRQFRTEVGINHGRSQRQSSRAIGDDQRESKYMDDEDCESKVKSSTDSCDRCDSKDHTTNTCPWFRKGRDKHPDAQKNKNRSIGGDGDGKVVYLKNARIITMPGDGSCLFHSLAHGLGGASNARRLRKDIANFISNNPNLEIADTPLTDWIKWDSGKSVTQYARRMAISGWGGGIECAACSRLMGVNVHIYEKNRSRGWSTSSSQASTFKRISCFDLPGLKGKHARTINVLYCGGVHYNALQI